MCKCIEIKRNKTVKWCNCVVSSRSELFPSREDFDRVLKIIFPRSVNRLSHSSQLSIKSSQLPIIFQSTASRLPVNCLSDSNQLPLGFQSTAYPALMQSTALGSGLRNNQPKRTSQYKPEYHPTIRNATTSAKKRVFLFIKQ